MARPCGLDDAPALLGGNYAAVLEANIVVSEAVLVLEAGELLAKSLDLGLDVGHLAALLDALDLVAEDVALLLVNLDAAGKDSREQEEAGAANEHVAADVQRHGGGLGHGVAVTGGLNEAGGSEDDSPGVYSDSLSNLLAELLSGAVDALATTQGDELIDIGDVVEQNIGQILKANVEELPDSEDDGVAIIAMATVEVPLI